MLKLKSLLGLFLTCCLLNISYAQTPSCERPQIIFVNGVWNNTPNEPVQGASALDKVLLEQGVTGAEYGNGGASRTGVRPYWNPGDGRIADVLEVFLNQRTSGQTLDSATLGAGLFWVKRLADLLGDKKPGANFQLYIDNLNTLIASEIGKRKPVVIVAHSQGNILANRAVQKLLQDNLDLDGLVSIVGVGVADDTKVGTGYRYVTYATDNIIGALPGSLPANFIGSGNPLQVLVDPSNHQFIETYLSNKRTNASGASLRDVVGKLSKEAFERVKCTGTKIRLTNSPTPLTANLDSAYSFNFLITPDIKIADKKLIGKVTVKSSTGATLCAGEISPDGTGACSVTFTGAPRTENIALSFEGRGGYVDSIGMADVNLVAKAQGYWRISLNPVTCSPAPGGGSWTWNHPCLQNAGPLQFGTGPATIYFAPENPTVVFESRGTRVVRKLGWDPRDAKFEVSTPTAFVQDVLLAADTSKRPYPLAVSNGTNTLTLTVSSRTSSFMTGSYTTTGMSGYFEPDFQFFEYWKTISTSSNGTWTANLVSGKFPEPQMNGYDFCNYLNGASMQMPLDTPLRNPRYQPGPFEVTPNACIYN